MQDIRSTPPQTVPATWPVLLCSWLKALLHCLSPLTPPVALNNRILELTCIPWDVSPIQNELLDKLVRLTSLGCDWVKSWGDGGELACAMLFPFNPSRQSLNAGLYCASGRAHGSI